MDAPSSKQASFPSEQFDYLQETLYIRFVDCWHSFTEGERKEYCWTLIWDTDHFLTIFTQLYLITMVWVFGDAGACVLGRVENSVYVAISLSGRGEAFWWWSCFGVMFFEVTFYPCSVSQTNKLTDSPKLHYSRIVVWFVVGALWGGSRFFFMYLQGHKCREKSCWSDFRVSVDILGTLAWVS